MFTLLGPMRGDADAPVDAEDIMPKRATIAPTSAPSPRDGRFKVKSDRLERLIVDA